MTHTTMCRWCGGEMELYWGFGAGLWQCLNLNCRTKSKFFGTEAEAIAWATQPIPFIPIAGKIGKQEEIGWYKALTEVISALGVKTKED